MPSALIKSSAEKAGLSIEETEKRWVKAKQIAQEERGLTEADGEAFWKYVVGIFRRSMGLLEDHYDSEIDMMRSLLQPTVSHPSAIISESGRPQETAIDAADQAQAAMKFVLTTHKRVLEAVRREDIGWTALLWGTAGTPPTFADGDGLARMVAKQNFERQYLPSEPTGEELCYRAADIVARGDIHRRYGTSSKPKIDITWKGEVSVIEWNIAYGVWALADFRHRWIGKPIIQ